MGQVVTGAGLAAGAGGGEKTLRVVAAIQRQCSTIFKVTRIRVPIEARMWIVSQDSALDKGQVEPGRDDQAGQR